MNTATAPISMQQYVTYICNVVYLLSNYGILIWSSSRWTWIPRRVPFCYPWAICVSPFYLAWWCCLFCVIWFHHMDTILVVLLVFLNLTLYLKLPHWIRTNLWRFYAYTFSPRKLRYLVKLHTFTLLITFNMT